MSQDYWLAQATPEEVQAYKRGRHESAVQIQRYARQITAYSRILSKIARGDFYDPAFAARQILNAHKPPVDQEDAA